MSDDVQKQNVKRRDFLAAGAATAAATTMTASAKANVDAQTILPMGGRKIEPSQGSRVTESAVRGFWKGWRECMGV